MQSIDRRGVRRPITQGIFREIPMKIKKSIVAALLCFLTVRPAYSKEPAAPLPIRVDKNDVAERLADYIRVDTSNPPGIPADGTAAHVAWLIRQYAEPLGLEHAMHGRSLLLTWRAAEPEAPPLLLLGHADVVPVQENERAAWTHPPFAGVITDGYVWGRGALDMKGTSIAQFEAIKALRAAGLAPRRTIYLLINPDEETGGFGGTKLFAAEFLSKLERPELVLDEGSFIVSDFLPGRNVAAVGVGEKSYLTIRLTVSTASGHASLPGPNDAPRVLTSALARLGAHEFPARLLAATNQFLDGLADAMPWPQSMVIGNRWLFGPLVRAKLSAKTTSNAMIRTTHALTMLRAGVKDNVIPKIAEATLNYRLMPGDTTEQVLAETAAAIGDERVRIDVVEFWGYTPVSPSSGPLWDRLEGILHAEIPRVLVGPIVIPGATDGRYFAQQGLPVYRFTPFTLDARDLKGPHGVDERVSLENLEQAVRFYARLFTVY